MRLPPPGLLAVLVPLALVASGCGSSSGEPAADTTTTAAPRPGDTVASTAYPVNFQVGLADSSPTWGRPVEVEGRVTGVGDDRTALLQFRRKAGRWRTIDRDAVAADGEYAFSARVPGTGAVRVTLAPRKGPAVQDGTVAEPEKTSPAQPVRVQASLSFAKRELTPDNDEQAVISGKVKPAVAARDVVAQAYTNAGWKDVATTATDGDGAYTLRWKPKGSRWVRVVADGDHRAGKASRLAGQAGEAGALVAANAQMTATGPMRQALASRYDDYDLPLACGGTLGRHEQGVAHKTLPCGTMVTITYNGRTVRVPVIDRGPYIEPREFDLTGATANTLGFEGVHMIAVSP